MTDMTITAVRTSILRVPWPDTPWLKGHAFGEARNSWWSRSRPRAHRRHGLPVRVPAGPQKTIVAALEETILPHVIGKDATAVEGKLERSLWKKTVTYNRGGIVTMAMSALDIALWGRHRQARQHAAASPLGPRAQGVPVYGSGCFRASPAATA